MPDQIIKLPDLNTLFKEAWDTTKGSAMRYFGWALVSILAMGFGIIVVGVLGGLLGTLIINALKSGPIAGQMFGNLLVIGLFLGLVGLFMWAMVTFTQVLFKMLAEYPKKRPIGELMQGSRKKILPLLGYIVLSIVFTAAWFPFIIPGLVASLFFSFGVFEIFLNDLGPWAAFKRSFVLWQTHTKALFVKFFLVLIGLFICSYLLNVPTYLVQHFLPSSIGQQFNIMIVVVMYVANIFLSVFIQVYQIKVFQHAEANTPQTIKPHMWWFRLFVILGWLTIALLIVGGIVFARSTAGQKLIQSINDAAQNKVKQEVLQVTTLDQAGATKLADDTFTTINEQRGINGLQAMAKDDNLCKYGQVMLKDFNANGPDYDPNPAFKKMVEGPQGQVYFRGYRGGTFYSYIGPKSIDKPENIITYWHTTAPDQVDIINDKDYRAGCIVADPNYMVFVLSR